MNKTETPRTFAVIDKYRTVLQYADILRYSKDMTANSEQLERELNDAKEELVETQKDYKCLAELLNGHDVTECRANLVEIKKQRDALTGLRNFNK